MGHRPGLPSHIGRLDGLHACERPFCPFRQTLRSLLWAWLGKGPPLPLDAVTAAFRAVYLHPVGEMELGEQVWKPARLIESTPMLHYNCMQKQYNENLIEKRGFHAGVAAASCALSPWPVQRPGAASTQRLGQPFETSSAADSSPRHCRCCP